MQETILEVDPVVLPPVVRNPKLNLETDNDLSEMSLVREKKTVRNTIGHSPDKQENINLPNKLPEGGDLSSDDQMLIISTLTMSLSDRNCGLEKEDKSNKVQSTAQEFFRGISSKEDSHKISHYLLVSAPVRLFRKKLIVLDINGLLADIVSPPPKDYKADKYIAKRAIFKRPFFFDFLNFCFERFDVGIWSSRTKKNVDRVIDYLIGDMKHKLLFCWDLSHCTLSKFKSLENKHKDLMFKELRKIWEKSDPNLPWEKGDYNESNTLLLDDSPYKALFNPPSTAIFPYSYKFHDRNDDSLANGGDLRVYLGKLAAAENIQKYVEQHQFGQSAITETSSSWGFYHNVISTMDHFPTAS